MKKVFIIALLAIGANCIPANADKTVTKYFGARASNKKNNPCEGPCDAVCKEVTIVTSNLVGGTLVEKVTKQGDEVTEEYQFVYDDKANVDMEILKEELKYTRNISNVTVTQSDNEE